MLNLYDFVTPAGGLASWVTVAGNIFVIIIIIISYIYYRCLHPFINDSVGLISQQWALEAIMSSTED